MEIDQTYFNRIQEQVREEIIEQVRCYRLHSGLGLVWIHIPFDLVRGVLIEPSLEGRVITYAVWITLIADSKND